MNIAIDLTWLKPKKSGGVETYIRNLLDGFLKLKDKNTYYLMTAKDNENEFDKYLKDKRFKQIKCDTHANEVGKHLLWQNTKQYKLLKNNNINFCFFPVYEMPLYKNKKIKCVTAIHDLQALHFPEYFSFAERVWFKMAWKRVVKNCDKVIAISDFTKDDIDKHYKNKNKVVTVHNPVEFDKTEEDFKNIEKKFNIKKNEYFYTLCSMHKHKNLITLLKVLQKIKDRKDIVNKLVISGVNGPNKDNLMNQIKELEIEDNVILTGFVSLEERNSLIKNSNVFLFPSIFEGFGLPPIEAMMLGSKVISTKCASIEEVTKGKCEYVDDPYDVDEWIKKIEEIQDKKSQVIDFKEYDNEVIAREYLNVFYEFRSDK